MTLLKYGQCPYLRKDLSLGGCSLMDNERLVFALLLIDSAQQRKDLKAAIGLNNGYGSTHYHALSIKSKVDLMGN